MSDYWKIVPSDDETDLSSAELLGIGITLASYATDEEDDIYRRTWKKIQPVIFKSQGWDITQDFIGERT